VNRWLQRLAEIDGDGARECARKAVHNVRNVQNVGRVGYFEHFEHCEQPHGSHALPASQAETARANNHSVRHAEVERDAAPPVPADFFDHRCSACGQPARFGYDVRLLRGETGRWLCAAHRPETGRA
jgi:hypothetical protein